MKEDKSTGFCDLKVGDSKMKILMIGPARSVNGGISAVVNNYYNAGLDKQIDITYIGTMEDGTKWHKLAVAVKALFRFLKEVSKCDIVHIHMASDSSLYRKMPFIYLSKLFHKKLVIHQHGGNIKPFFYEECGSRMQKFIKKTLEKADKFLVVAPYLRDIFKDIISEEKIMVFPNSIECPIEIAPDYQKKELLFLGRLCKEKGIRELLEAVGVLRKEFPDLNLYLGGVWVDEELKEMADANREYIHQLGWVNGKTKEEYLRKCNIFVLPTYFEGLPMSLLEGMAYGCACVASEVGGIPQVVKKEEDGILIPSKDVTALEQALRRLLLDTDLQKRLGKNARKKVLASYDLVKSIKKLLDVYASL